MSVTLDPGAGTGEPAVADGRGGIRVRADSGIRRLSPADGLFLRAEHLTVMQDYARDLVSGLGVAVGSGTVHGLTTTVDADADALHVGPGLGIAPGGHPLPLPAPVTVPLAELTDVSDAARYWLVELVAGSSRGYGDEPVYGSVCADACESSGRLQPWLDAGVSVRVTPATLNTLSTTDGRLRRNVLASALFEKERAGGPWLTPSRGGIEVGTPTSRDWSVGVAAPEGDGVALGVLLRVDGRWVLDVWAARRDVGAPPSSRVWDTRLAMRPREVFLAQVRQFQEQLAARLGPSGGRAPLPSVPPDPLYLDLANDVLREKRSTKGVLAKATEVRERETALRDRGNTAREREADGAFALPDLGFTELPPAGYLPVPPDVQDRRTWFTTAFGGNVDVRVCRAAADDIAGEVDRARHLDRIPLTATDGPAPRVTVLVPAVEADLEPLRATSYGWAAFVRRRDRVCDDDPDGVGPDRVSVRRQASDDSPELVLAGLTAGTDLPPEVGTLDFPADGVDPVPNAALEALSQRFAGEVVRGAVWLVPQDGEPLAGRRAAALGSTLGAGATVPVDGAVSAAVDRETIVLLVPRYTV